MTSQVEISTDNCRLCAVFGRQIDAPPGIDSPWLKDSKYAALISFGAIVPGWTLLSPLSHAANMQSSYADANFWDFAAQAEAYLSARYGQVAVFEHGPIASESLTGCGTGHAHMHLVPLTFSLAAKAIEFDEVKSWIECSALDVSKYAAGHEYLFVSDKFDGAQTKGLLCILKEPTSQFFRKVIARQLGMLEFSDYRKYPMLDIVETSSQQLAADVAAHMVNIA
ncbi:hypothetical protein ACEN9F_22630 [Duganella sp. CT11-25]|uniref:hypothetical protein n=1 Tax=unclassified Duganella TaxID=2636909 RepID=UPI0039B0BD1F